MDRREALRIIAVSTVAAVAAGCGWLSKSKPQKPEEVSSAIPEGSSWLTTPAIEKIQRLEFKQYPNIPDFDPTQELVSATARFYCEQTICKKDPEQIAQDVFFLTPEQFLEEVQRHEGRVFTEEEKERLLRTTPEATGRDGKVFINASLHKQLIEETLRTQPQTATQLGGRDAETVMTKSMLFHAYSHVNESHELYNFLPFQLPFQAETGPITIDRIEGLVVKGKHADGRPLILTGGREAIIELSAITIGKRAGPYASLVKGYYDGAALLDMVNRKSNIADQEFLEYASGSRSIKDLLGKWGRLKNRFFSDEKAAVMIFTTIGLRVENRYTQAEALQAIEYWLRR